MFVKVQPASDSTNNQEIPILSRSLFKSIRTILLFGGIYSGGGPKTSLGKRAPFSKLKQLFLIIVVSVYLMNFGVFGFSSYERFVRSRSVTSRRIAFFAIYLSCFVLSILGSLTLPKDLPLLENTFDSYEKRRGLKIRIPRWNKAFKIANVIYPILCVLVVSSTLWMLTQDRNILCDVYTSCELPSFWKYIGFGINFITHVMTTFQWLGYYFVCFQLTLFLFQEFKRVSKEFQNCVGAETSEGPFFKLVEHHEELIDMLNEVNNTVRQFLFSSMFLSLPANCSFLYAAISTQVTNIELMYLCSGMSFATGILAVRLFFEALVSSKAHEPLQCIWKLQTDGFTKRGLLNLDIFVSRLTGETIGFSVYSLLTINMSTLLGIVGTVATYIIIVIQFKPTDPTALCENLVKNITSCPAV